MFRRDLLVRKGQSTCDGLPHVLKVGVEEGAKYLEERTVGDCADSAPEGDGGFGGQGDKTRTGMSVWQTE
jgi:hypothetical protein